MNDDYIELPDLPEVPEIELPDLPDINIPDPDEVFPILNTDRKHLIPKPPMPPDEFLDRVIPKGPPTRPFAWLVGITDDILDYTPIGELPVIGDALDALSMFAIRRAYPKQQAEQAIEFAEFIPFGDILPSMTAGLFSSEMAAERRRK